MTAIAHASFWIALAIVVGVALFILAKRLLIAAFGVLMSWVLANL